MKDKIIIGEKACYYNYGEKLWDGVATLYNYNYLKTNTNVWETFDLVVDANKEQKYYFKTNDECGLINLDNSLMALTEVISLGYRLLEEMGIEAEVEVAADDSKELDKIIDNFTLLDVDYELGDVSNTNFKDPVFKIVNSKNETLIRGGAYKTGYVAVIDLNNLILMLEQMKDKRLLQNTLDVLIEAQGEEEKMVGMRLVQDLRWSDLKSDLNTKNEARLTVILDKEYLNKGLMQVKDNLTGDINEVDENEILDYLISNL